MKRAEPLTVKETALYAMFGVLMYCSKLVMEALPNIHLIGMFVVLFTVVYRAKALYPIYVFVFLTGLLNGFSAWWLPYLYIWTVLWGAVMLLPKNMKPGVQAVVYPLVCALHGLCYGTLYAPAQALMYGLSFEQTVAWIAAGLPWDAVHAAGNLAAGLLILPFSRVLRKLNARFGI